MTLTKLQFNWPFGSGEEVKNRFSRWPPWRPSWIFDRNYLATFNLQVTPMLPPSFKSISLSVQEKKRKIDFQAGIHHHHLGFPIETILSFFYLQDTPMLPTKFRGNWSFGSEEETKNRFSR